MISTGCWIKHPAHLQHSEETNPLFSSWQNEIKSRSKASSLAITHIKFHQGWEVFLCCFHDGINVFAVTGVLHSTVMENCWRSFCHCHCLLQYRLQRQETHQTSDSTSKLAPTWPKFAFIVCILCPPQLVVCKKRNLGFQKKATAC